MNFVTKCHLKSENRWYTELLLGFKWLKKSLHRFAKYRTSKTNNCVKHVCTFQGNSLLATQWIFPYLWQLKVHKRVHNSTSLSVLWTNPTSSLTPISFLLSKKKKKNILLLGSTSKILYAFVTFPMWVSRVAHLLFLIWWPWQLQVSYNFLLLESKKEKRIRKLKWFKRQHKKMSTWN
jgi:hypothetical protein